MKKTLLTERFQQLAGIKPLYGNKLNENISMFSDYISSLYDADVEEKEGFQSGIWEKEEYGDPKAYKEADKFISLMSYLDSVGGKATLEGNPDINLELLPGGDIQWSANVTLSEEKEIKEITVSGGQEAARNYPPTENPGDMFAQKEVEELLPASFASRNQELKARIQAHAEWAKKDRYNNTFVHFQSNTVTDGNNTYRIAMSQHYNGNYTDFKNPKFTEIRVKELDNESDMERDLGKYVVDTTALMQDLRKLKTIERIS